jgi:hypothetical protein
MIVLHNLLPSCMSVLGRDKRCWLLTIRVILSLSLRDESQTWKVWIVQNVIPKSILHAMYRVDADNWKAKYVYICHFTGVKILPWLEMNLCLVGLIKCSELHVASWVIHKIAIRDVTIYRSQGRLDNVFVTFRDVTMTWTSDNPRRFLLISAYLKLKNLCSHVVFAIIAVKLMRTDTSRAVMGILAAQTCTSTTLIASLKA